MHMFQCNLNKLRRKQVGTKDLPINILSLWYFYVNLEHYWYWKNWYHFIYIMEVESLSPKPITQNIGKTPVLFRLGSQLNPSFQEESFGTEIKMQNLFPLFCPNFLSPCCHIFFGSKHSLHLIGFIQCTCKLVFQWYFKRSTYTNRSPL